MPETLVTVCIATYNHGEYISKCLKSVLNQKTSFKYKILLGDDSSTDNTQEIIHNFAVQYPGKITAIFRKENLGCPYNGLDLWQKVKSKYIAILDGDDFWTDPDKLQKQIDYLEANPNVSCCATDFDQINKDGVFEKNPEPYPEIVKLKTETIIRSKWCPTQTCTIVFHTSLLDLTPLFLHDQLIVCGDWALSCWFSTKGEVHILPDTTCTKRMNSGGIWSSKSNILNAYRLICFSCRMPRYFPRKYKQYFRQNLVRDMPIFLEQLIHLQNFKESSSYIFALIKIPIHISFIPSILKTFLIIVMNTIRMKKFSFQ